MVHHWRSIRRASAAGKSGRAPKVRPDLRLPGIGRGWGCWGEGGGTGSDQGLETLAEAVGPVGDGETEGRLDLGLVEDRVGGTPDGARKLVGVAGLDVAGSLAGECCDHLGEVKPAADAFVAVVIDAGVRIGFRVRRGTADSLLIISEDREYGHGEVAGVGGCAGLVEDNLELRLFGRQAEHRADEVLAEFAVEPGGAQDDMLATHAGDGLLAMELGQPVDARGRAGLLFAAGGVVWVAAEDVVRADVDQQAAGLFHRNGEVLRSLGVEELRQFGALFGGVHVGEGCAVDDGVDVLLAHQGADGFQVGDVEPARGRVHGGAGRELLQHGHGFFRGISDVGEEEAGSAGQAGK